jgi:hypothetical protein
VSFHILVSSLSDYTTFFYIIIQSAQVSENVTEHKMYTLYTILYKSFLIIRIIKRDIIINVHRSSCEVPIVIANLNDS